MPRSEFHKKAIKLLVLDSNVYFPFPNSNNAVNNQTSRKLKRFYPHLITI